MFHACRTRPAGPQPHHPCYCQIKAIITQHKSAFLGELSSYISPCWKSFKGRSSGALLKAELSELLSSEIKCLANHNIQAKKLQFLEAQSLGS